MSNMSSFYGGRSGAPFIIVKTFDGISLPESVLENKITYTKTYYAVDENNKFKITENAEIGNVDLGENKFLIKKTAENYKDYNWKIAINDGSRINNSAEENAPKFPIEKAQGMVEFFSKGAETLDEVNYQEYVLIDTATRMNEYLNPDNGKLFRRGLNVNNGLAGAEYIGRIIGAQGFNTGIQFDTYSNITSLGNDIEQGILYTDLVPGGQISTDESGQPIVIDNNKIECVYANVLTEDGNVLETKIGFKFPYLVNTFKSELVVPYNLPNNLILETDAEGRILNNEIKNNNPFFRHWTIKIPQGFKGDSIEEIRVQPTAIPANTPYYNDLETLKSDIEANNGYLNRSGIIAEKIVDIPSNTYDRLNNCIILKEDTESEPIYKYIDSKLCTNKKVYYIIRNYETLEEGSLSEPIEVGDIDSIIKTNLADDGTFTIYYDNGKIEIVKPKIKWITNTNLNTETSKLEIDYNEGSKDVISPAINYIEKIYISTEKDYEDSKQVIPSKHLYIKFSDPAIKNLGITIPGQGSGWTDFGSVIPPAEGLKIVGDLDSVDELTAAPEILFNNPEYRGWAVTINGNILYYYDYRQNKWINAGTISEADVTTKIIKISSTEPEKGTMNTQGIWMVSSSIEARE